MRKGVLIALLCSLAVGAGVFLWLNSRGAHRGKTIAYIVPTLANPFFVDMNNAAREALQNTPDVKLVVQAPTEFTSVEQQITMIENVVTLKVDALCLVAADSKGVVPSLRKVQDAHIPILLVDNTIDPTAAKNAGVNPSGHVGSDNLLGGKMAGQFIGEALKGRGKVAMLEGVVGSDVANARKQGFLSALAMFPGLQLVASQTANYSRDQALDVFQNILQANSMLDGLFAANDEMALGAIKAIRQSGFKRKIVVVGFDATADGLAAIQDGSMNATIQQQPKEMGKIAVELALRLIQGQSIPPETMVPVKLVSRQN